VQSGGTSAAAAPPVPETTTAGDPPPSDGPDLLGAASDVASSATSTPLRGATEAVSELLGGAVGGTAEVADALLGELGASLTESGRSVGRRVQETAGRLAGPTEQPARDLGVPAGILALLGAYLAATRWLDRGGMPMSVAEGQEDDVKLVL
jgi:hypothetical protein